jgi:hypothetical protein
MRSLIIYNVNVMKSEYKNMDNVEKNICTDGSLKHAHKILAENQYDCFEEREIHGRITLGNTEWSSPWRPKT